MIEDSIVALASGQGGAIAIIRLSGSDVKELVNKVLKKPILDLKSYSISHNYIISDNQEIDEVLVSYFQAPKSYTGEDSIEISIHGSSFLADKIVSLLVAKGARLALPGEFTQRAYLNGKVDLSQAEAINDLIRANTSYRATKAFSALAGSISRLIKPLSQELLDIIANIEVNIDYPEYEDVRQLSQKIIQPEAEKWLHQIEEIILKSESSLLLKEGIQTVIIGEPNVGKSSLLNALLQKNRALVSDIAGTTRDYIEAEIVVDQIHLRLIDTAGLRESEDRLEQLSMEQTRQLIDQAQLVILVVDATKERSANEKYLLDLLKDKNHIVFYNKVDLLSHNDNKPAGSALQSDIQELLTEIKNRYLVGNLLSTPTLQSQRQLGLMKGAKESLSNALVALKKEEELELVAIDLNQSYQQLSDILGEYQRMDLLESIFSNFCVGK